MNFFYKAWPNFSIQLYNTTLQGATSNQTIVQLDKLVMTTEHSKLLL